MFALRQKTASFDEVIDRLDHQAGTNTWSGATVTIRTAMQQATVFACVRLLAETIASLPITAQTRNANRQWIDTEHDVLNLLARPNDWQTQHDLISHWVAWSELRGNAYNYKAKTKSGEVRLLYPLTGTGVTVEQKPDWSLLYNVSNETGFSGTFGPAEIFHLRNFGTDGAQGLSTIAQLRNDVGLAQRAKEHGARVFANGASTNKWIKAPGVKSAEAARDMQRQFHATHGGAENTGLAPVMWGGAELEEIGMTTSDAQLLETLRFQKEELAGAFGVPGFLVNAQEKSTSWGTGLEQITKSFVRFSLRPRIDRITSTLHRELLPRSELASTRFVFETDAFTMGSFKEIVEALGKAVDAGLMNPDEGREMLNRNPRPGGDVYRQTPNSVPEGDTDEDEDEAAIPPAGD